MAATSLPDPRNRFTPTVNLPDASKSRFEALLFGTTATLAVCQCIQQF